MPGRRITFFVGYAQPARYVRVRKFRDAHITAAFLGQIYSFSSRHFDGRPTARGPAHRDNSYTWSRRRPPPCSTKKPGPNSGASLFCYSHHPPMNWSRQTISILCSFTNTVTLMILAALLRFFYLPLIDLGRSHFPAKPLEPTLQNSKRKYCWPIF